MTTVSHIVQSSVIIGHWHLRDDTGRESFSRDRVQVHNAPVAREQRIVCDRCARHFHSRC